MKTCTKCGEAKPSEAFYKRRDGHRSECKDCERDRYKTWLENNPDKRRAINDRYEANKPERHAEYRAKFPDKCKQSTKEWRAKNYARFYASTRKWFAANPECQKKSHAAWREAHREETRERTRQWRKENPERQNQQSRIKRARKANIEGSHTLEEWRALVDRFKGHCLCCRQHFGFEKLTLDHVIPITRGGSDYISNAQPLCSSCNSSKGNHHATDYRKTWEPAE